MSIKIYTIADRIKAGFIPFERLKNIQQFADSEQMILSSIPLKDGTTAKLLANACEYDCLIMKNGKILTAKGKVGTPTETAEGIFGFFEHLNKRDRAEKDVNIDFKKYEAIEDYLKRFGKLLPDI